MFTPKIIIHIAPSGNPLSDGGESVTGHMWITLQDSFGNQTSFGLAPRIEGQPSGAGKIYTTDDEHYIDPPYNYEKEISEAQYESVLQWALKAQRDSDAGIGRWDEYNGLYNSCVDFTWEAMNQAGLTDSPQNGWQGALLPWSNRWQVERRLKPDSITNPTILSVVSTWFRTAITPPRRDPLAIDLDGDGIETVGIPSTGSPILFDHDADGVKTGTGWLKGDDAWLALDRDGNGSIDSGRELFGVDTLITVTESLQPDGPLQTVTRNARSGFEALRMLDTGNGTAGSAGYGDGVFDARDAQFANVKLWRDLNQDGISQSGELLSLADMGIKSMALTPSTTSTNLGNGNTVTGQAVVTRSNGSTTQIDSVDLQASNLNLADNPFYREFTDSIALTELARALPEMGAAGWVRDMREAMSLGTPAGDAFAAVVSQYAQAGTRDDQLALMDQLLQDWAETTGRFDQRSTRAVQSTVTAQNGVTRTEHFTTVDPSFYDTVDLTHVSVPAVRFDLQGTQYYETVTPSDPRLAPYQVLNAEGAEVLRRLGVLEAFNGSRFFNLDQTFSLTSGGSSSGGSGGGTGVQAPGFQVYWSATLTTQQIDALNKAYDALEQSVYGALVTQTRLQKYLDAVGFAIDENGLHFDTTPLVALLDSAAVNDSNGALGDLIDLNRYMGSMLSAVGFEGVAKLRSWIEGLAPDSPLRATLPAMDVLTGAVNTGSSRADIYLGDTSANTFNGSEGEDIIDGGAGNDRLTGGFGDDRVFGGEGSDILFGSDGNDTIEGGAGNDVLVGGNESGGWNGSNYYTGVGNDTYRFGRGDGQDTIWDVDGTAGNLDTISLKEGVAPSDVRTTRPAGTNNLTLSIVGTTDSVTVANFFIGDGSGGYATEQITFADGTVWDLAAIKAQALLSTANADDITGYASDDQINAGDGNDRVWAGAGSDLVSGAGGNDTLWAEDGNDVVNSGDGADTVFAGTGNDVIDGGAGNDVLVGGNENGNWNGSNYYAGQGNDTYRFGWGDGQDTIWDVDATAGNLDTIALKAGVAPSDVRINRPLGSNNLILSIGGGADTLTVANFFVADGSGGYAVEQITFGNGTIWDLATIKAQALLPTASADDIVGYASDDEISAGDGNDRAWGRGGNDTMLGGAGNDQLWGEAGNDALDGGAGNDVLVGGIESGNWNGANYYNGAGNDTYRFGRADGQDTIWDVDVTSGNLDTIALKEGVAAGDVRITRPAGTNNLILSIAGTTDTLTVANFFVGDGSGGYAIEQMTFADGTVWDLATIRTKALTVGATGNADDLTGYALDDYIDGQAGNDRIWGRGGDDLLVGGAGNDTVWGEEGSDALNGGDGADVLFGGTGDDVIEGGAGNDVLVGGIDNGNWNGANYYNGAGNDTYRFGRGDGQDTVWDVDVMSGNLDTIALKDGVAPTDVRVSRPLGSNNLILSIAGTTDSVTVANFFVGDGSGGYAIEQITFADGTSWDLAAIKAQALLPTATADDIVGYAGDDQINGADGNDRLWGRTGNDALLGGAGNDQIWGEAGNDVIEGGAGNDVLVGGIENGNWNGSNYYNGAGNDTYRFGRGDGQDTIWDFDSTSGNLDTIALKEGVVAGDVRISRPLGSNNLILSIAGTTDTLTVANFFAGDGSSGYAIEQITFADGTSWDLAAIKARALLPTANADDIVGYAGDDQINGADGNDRVWGRAGNDTLLGGAGNDQIWGEAGNDVIEGGAGNDLLVGGNENGNWNGSNYYNGAGNDTYRFGRGDGQDTVWDVDATAGNLDTVALKEGVAPSDVRITRPAGTNNLILSIAGTTDTLTVANFFVGDGTGGYAIEQMNFADGTFWDLAAIKAQALLPTANADDVTGYASDDQINAGDGNDRVWARAGNDVVQAGAGNDQLWGEDGNDVLSGGDGADTMFAGIGNDVIEGGAGNDVLVGGIDNGNWNGANYYNGAGNDTYRFGRGDGQDTIWDVDATAGNLDTIALKAGVAPSDVRINRPLGSNNLILSIAGTTDSVTVANFFAGDGSGGYAIEQITFADGTSWDLAAIKAQALLPTATADDIVGYAGDDQINGADGNDRIWGRTGNDALLGGAGNDQIWGEAGNDVIEGGAGNDVLVGGNENGNWNGANYYNGAGNDTYRFGRGDGQDTLWDVDATAGNADVLSFLSDISTEQLWFRQVGSALEVSIIGTDDRVQIANWFAGASYHVEKFKTANGQTLLDSNVQNLVNAMAGFAPPGIGQTSLPANYQSTLLPTIASNWASG